MTDRNTGDISGVLVERAEPKDYDSGLRCARVLIRTTAPGYDGKPDKETEVELSAWGRVADVAASIPAGSRVLVSYRLGGRKSDKGYRNLTASVQSIVALMPSGNAAKPAASLQEARERAEQPRASGESDVPF